jgi:hypothetical protein
MPQDTDGDDVRLKANAQNSLEKRDGHEGSRPSALHKIDLAILHTLRWNRRGETFSIGEALVVCGINPSVGKVGLGEGGRLRNRLWRRNWRGSVTVVSVGVVV